MTEQDIAGIRAQIERQTIERGHYADAIAAQTATVEKLQSAMQPDIDQLAALEAQLAELNTAIEKQREQIASQQRMIDPEQGKLGALNENAAALDRAILGCKVLIGEE